MGKEPNDDHSSANELIIFDENGDFLYQVITGNISDNSDIDNYKFSLENTTEVSIGLWIHRVENDPDQHHNITLLRFNEDGTETDVIETSIADEKEYSSYTRIETEIDSGDYLIEITSFDDAEYNLVVDL